MRLLNIYDFSLHTFYGDSIPPYAILSHTWLKDEEEVTFAQIQSKHDWQNILGAKKIRLLCEQAAKDGITWAWIDTCCIDKTNSSELSEAINSMFRWYQNSKVCYAYLMDIDLNHRDNFLCSRWWSRAWTLQELLAPTAVQFFDTNWNNIGTKEALADLIATNSGMDVQSLQDASSIPFKSVAQRMSWAAHRKASRTEDLAYSLLGIFGINMTMQYGEGSEAFIRLQREIMHTSDDLSLFAWGFTRSTLDEVISQAETSNHHVSSGSHTLLGSYDDVSRFGIFASQPLDFEHCKDIELHGQHIGSARTEEQHGTLTLHAPMVFSGDHKFPERYASLLPSEFWIALLPCGLRTKLHMLLAILLQGWNQNDLAQPRSMRSAIGRNVFTFLVDSEYTAKAGNKSIKVDSLFCALHFRSFSDKRVLRRTLTVICKTKQVSKFTTFSVDRWETDEGELYILSAIDDLPQKGLPSTRLGLILQFPLRNSVRLLYICLRLKRRPHEVDRLAIVEGGTIRGFPLDKESPKLRWSTLDWRDSRTSLHLQSNRKSLFAEIHTQIVYNQAVSTLTIKGSGGLVNEGSVHETQKPTSTTWIDAT